MQPRAILILEFDEDRIQGFRGAVALLTILPTNSDGDGMPDAWELANGLAVGVNDANLDPDGDGMTNLQEYLAGTNPTNAASALRIESVELVSSGEFVLSFTAVSNRTCTVQVRPQPGNFLWTDLARVTALPANRMVWFTDMAGTQGARFFRLAIP